MSITIYSGVPGSGKTYEVVESVIIPAICAGRRVLTNVAGLKVEDIYNYCDDKTKGEGRLGTIEKFVYRDELLPSMRIPESISQVLAKIEQQGGDPTSDDLAAIAEASKSSDAFMKAGDLFIFDEAWRAWPKGKKIATEHQELFRMHRHYVDVSTGVSMDIVLVSQNHTDIHLDIRGLVVTRFQTQKHIAIGAPSRYVVNVFQGNERKPYSSQQKRYNKEIFSLYRSYSMGGKGGKEHLVDKRSNILGSAFFSIVLPIALLLGGLGVFGVYNFFSPPKDAKAAVAPARPGQQPDKATPSNPTHIISNTPAYTERWRIVGYSDFDGQTRVLLEDSQGTARYLVPVGKIKGWGRTLSITLDEGEVVAFFTGNARTKQRGMDLPK